MESPILLSTATTKAAGKKAAIGKRDAAGKDNTIGKRASAADADKQDMSSSALSARYSVTPYANEYVEAEPSVEAESSVEVESSVEAERSNQAQDKYLTPPTARIATSLGTEESPLQQQKLPRRSRAV
jgi:hypothetical protein